MVRAGQVLRTLWQDRCTIQIMTEYTKPNSAKGKRLVTLTEDEPCKLSYFNGVHVNSPSSDTPLAAQVVQRAKLFVRPDLDIPAGSRITVTTHTNGIVLYFENSGIPAYFTNHQEISLEARQKWA